MEVPTPVTDSEHAPHADACHAQYGLGAHAARWRLPIAKAPIRGFAGGTGSYTPPAYGGTGSYALPAARRFGAGSTSLSWPKGAGTAMANPCA